MIYTVEKAKEKRCIFKAIFSPMPFMKDDDFCIANECMTAWRWADLAKKTGYCGIGGIPEDQGGKRYE